MKIYDAVALIIDLPDKGLQRGQVGTIVEQLAETVYDVEFSDDTGKSYALLPLDANQLMVLHYHPQPMNRAS